MYDLTGQRYNRLFVLEREPSRGVGKQIYYEDMGDRPAGKTLDRINPYGNYEPNNCRWATYKEQVHNRRRNYTVPEGVTPLC